MILREQFKMKIGVQLNASQLKRNLIQPQTKTLSTSMTLLILVLKVTLMQEY
jgi:hypothetical protein